MSEAIALAREATRQRGDLTGAYRVLTVAAGMAGQIEVAKAALQELRRTQPNISLAWIATQLPWKHDADREHFLEGFAAPGWNRSSPSEPGAVLAVRARAIRRDCRVTAGWF